MFRIVFIIFILISTVNVESVLLKQHKSFKDLSAEAIGYWRGGEKEKAITLYKKSLKLFPEKKYSATRTLAFMFMKLEKLEKMFEVYEFGHSHELYYPFYIKSGPMSKLMKHDRFKKIYKKNNELIKLAERQTEPLWEINIPKNHDKLRTYPLIVVLHGWSGSLKTVKTMWISEKHKDNMIIVYLQSSQLAGIEAYKWDDINKTQKDVLNVLDIVKSKYKINTKQILIAGFSQGGAAAIKLVIENRIKVSGFIAHCPGGEFINKLDPSNLKNAVQKGIKGIVLSTENDHSKELQKNIIKQFEAAKFKHKYIEIKGIGHWYPKDFSKYLDNAIDFLMQNKRNNYKK